MAVEIHKCAPAFEIITHRIRQEQAQRDPVDVDAAGCDCCRGDRKHMTRVRPHRVGIATVNGCRRCEQPPHDRRFDELSKGRLSSRIERDVIPARLSEIHIALEGGDVKTLSAKSRRQCEPADATADHKNAVDGRCSITCVQQ